MNLRPYQLAAVDAIRADYVAGRKRTLLVLATGLGKTVIAAEIARRVVGKRGRVLFLAHRRELLEQAAAKLHAAGVDAAIEGGTRRAGHADVVVASVQSLRGKRLAQWPRDAFQLVIVDEAHRSASTGHRTAIDTFDAHVLGLTATPDRLDGQALGDVYDSVAYRYELREGIRDGWLSRLTAKRVLLEAVDLTDVKTVAGDLDPEALAALLETERALHGVAVPLLRESGARRTVAFCISVAQAEGLARIANGYEPGVAAIVHGEMRPEVRRRVLADYTAGRTRILFNCALLVEGWDDPETACVALCRPTKSRALFVQAVGRGTRLAPGKTDCIAEGERVLTDVGLVAIESVTRAMRVWDGVEFVEHGGAVCRGVQDVIEYAGLVATPDHRVWTDDGWKDFATCAAEQTPIRVTGAGREAVREADRRDRRDCSSSGSRIHRDTLQFVRRDLDEGLPERDHEGRGMSPMRQPASCSEVAVEAMRVGADALSESQRQELSALRGAGHSVRVRDTACDGALRSADAGSATRDAHRPDRQRRKLRSGESSVSLAEAERVEYTQTSRERRGASLPTCPPGGEVRRLDSGALDREGHDRRADRSEIPRPVVQTQGRVWDLVNAGPRHRFTVEGLLVSNCLVLDLTPGTVGRHRLAGPADVLAGRFVDPDQRALLDALLLAGHVDLEAALVTAVEAAEVSARAEAASAIAKYRVEELDPWLDVPPSAGNDATDPPTEKQLAALKKLGIPPPPNATAAGAARILAAHATRLSAGLCSVRAAKALVRGGLPAGAARTLTAAEAKPMLTALQRTGWRYVPRALLAKFLTTTTTPSVSPAAERAA